MPTLRQLEYFLAVAELKHFGHAAQLCNISQPTLSHQLRTLEERLGTILIDRGSSLPELTPVGREIAERAKRVMLEIRDIRGLASRSRNQLAGIVRLGVTPTLGPYLMPAIIGALHVEQPELRLYIREGIPVDQARDLVAGRLDMLVGPQPIAGEGLEILSLFNEPLSVVAPNHHPLVGKARLECTDLAGAHFLTLDHRHHFHQIVQTACARFGAEILHDYEGTSLDSIHQMVGSGVGLAILPELYLRSDVGGEAMVVRLPVSDWSSSRQIAAAWRARSANAEDYRALSMRIRDKARNLLI
ncbi:hydrogen peroxide-inducible genes activator [Novosphingobium sp. CECT 9465]|uniref:hydrogen peroxide-inducible genes activator n=1 Tax=Novosphingobium sp. CECT 9465 TaxID=2829794 RepID=UPI001E4B95E8|nr:hydrogen peroxide-inducible genes activator [Novosphingobium sp. CECT 9465]CAH0498721.1 Hydrogen peroxide-inducible genes activator [Novosphingobium sp. CECT 9465]